MDLTRALDQLSEIHHHLNRTEVCRGYRSRTIAVTAVVAVVGSALYPYLVATPSPLNAVKFWMGLACINLVIVGWDIAWDYAGYSRPQQRVTRKTIGQFVPALFVGGVATLAFSASPELIGYLPGLWSLIYGLGIFSSRPYLPQGVGWVALFYVVSGTYLLMTASAGFSSPWLMGVVFGGGQVGLSAVLYWNLERS